MSKQLDLAAMLRSASPATRRAVFKRAAGAGISGAALLALLRADGVADVAAAPGSSGPRIARRAQDGEPVQGGTMIVTGHQEVASLSPDDSGPSVHLVIVQLIHNALVELDENFEFQPVLAEAFPEVSEDGLTYTFQLRQGVLFHDGEELTSEDVKYTYEWYMDPENAAVNANAFISVESVEAPDPYTVVVTLRNPNAAFFPQVASRFIVPAHYHGEIGEDEYKAAPIGTGAFKVREWRAADFTELEAFEDHFRGRPYLDVFRQDIVPEPSVRAIALETGAADSAVWQLSPEDNLRLAEDDDFNTYIMSSLAVNHFPLNNDHPILSEKLVRQAMMFAIDRETVIDEVFSGTAVLATANLSPALDQYYNPDVAQYPYDPEQAVSLLEEAGWMLEDGEEIRSKDGESLTFTCTTISGDQTRRPEAELVQQYLREVGIDMQLEEAPVATILEQMRAGTMDASLYNWTYGGDDADPDASVTLRSDGTNNFSHFRNDRVDELLDMGLQEIDPEARAEIYKEIQAIVAEEVPFLFMMFWNWYTIINKRIQGVPDSALTMEPIFGKAWQFWIAEEDQ
jgi:peptide/nickel transport system substrate-binding protein